MKRKIIIIITLGIFLTFLIYQNNKKEEITLVVLGDGMATGMTPYGVEGYNYNDYLKDYLEQQKKLKNYNNDFSKNNQTTKELLQSIEQNEYAEKRDMTIQQILSKAKIITIGIGVEELNNNRDKQKSTGKMIQTYQENMEKIMEYLRNFNNHKIYLLGIYLKEEEEKEETINTFLKDLSQKYQLEFIDISELQKEKNKYFLNNSYYLNYKGHQKIFEKIINTNPLK